MNPIEEVLRELLDDRLRHPVLRTRLTEERRPLPDHRRRLVLRRDRYRCVICGKGGLLEVDHIIPWSAGGGDNMDNLRTLCRDCNQDRSNFAVPADNERRLLTAHQCVYCNPHLVGENDLTAVYCIQCNKRAAGVPVDPLWHPDIDREPPYWCDGVVDVERPDLEDLLAKVRCDAVRTIRRALDGDAHA